MISLKYGINDKLETTSDYVVESMAKCCFQMNQIDHLATHCPEFRNEIPELDTTQLWEDRFMISLLERVQAR